MVLLNATTDGTLRFMDELGRTLHSMDSTRLLLALTFVAAYACAIGRLLAERSRRWSVGIAALAGLAFTGLTDPWVHGALLVAFGVLGVGAFIALAWLFSFGAMRWQAHAVSPLAMTHAAMPTTSARMVMVARPLRRVRRRFSPL